MFRYSAVVVLGLLVAACGQEPIYNVNAHPIATSAQALPLAQVEKTIIDAGQSRGWRFERLGPGKLSAVQDQPKFAAEVEITFDQRRFNIAHVSSRGMKEQGSNIHPHYNFWIRNLESDIDTWLANAARRTNR
ncbi:MAG: hypothetical protein HY985_05115 [Magnetospirillum sp.]|nr:hypothetical protein [Magnetospirillum sp.]